MEDNFTRMVKLADEVFGMRHDPTQISVNAKVRARLLKIHSNTLSERRTKKGPIAWVLIFPTTDDLMRQFIKKRISEKELLYKTKLNVMYESIYLCSALVLPEHRRKGIAKKIMCKAVKSIQKLHPIKYLFYWEFTKEGKLLAEAVAREVGLKLFKRKK